MAAVAVLAACGPGYTQKREAVTVGIPWLEQNALIFIAEKQGFFANNGLDVTLKPYDTGPSAVGALLKGEVDIAGTAEYPFVHLVLDKEPVRILSSVDRFENNLIVARKDSGIAKIADLKGKRIGVARQTNNAFYLGRLLLLNHIQPEDVVLVDLKPGQFQQAIAGGEVDALIAWQPYVYQIQQAVPGVSTWPAQSSQMVYGLMVSRDAWIADHPGTVVNYLKSLVQAEAYLIQNPDQSKSIVQDRLQYDDSYMNAIWADHHFSLTLDHSLIVAMNDEARWMINNQPVPGVQPPDFLAAIYLDAMNTVKPDAVEITP